MTENKREYKNPFTLDGLLKVPHGVTPKKVGAVKTLIEETMSGSRIAKGQLEESLTTSDAIFNFAHLTNINVLKNFPDVPRIWKEIAPVRTLSDFRPATLYSINPDWAETSATLGANVISPRVPEGSAYPYATFKPEQASSGAGVVKRGFVAGFSLEAAINDLTGFLESLPDAFRKIALDTEEYEVFAALAAALTTDNDVEGGTNVEGVVVPPNPKLSRAAVLEAMTELGDRTINGRQVVLSGGYKLLVPANRGAAAKFALRPNLVQINDGSFILSVDNYDPLAGIVIEETIHLTGDQWVLIPNANSAGRPIIEAFQLAGYQLPQLHVKVDSALSANGNVGPFDKFSFENDTTDLRIRQFFGAEVWTPDLIIWSSGAGS